MQVYAFDIDNHLFRILVNKSEARPSLFGVTLREQAAWMYHYDPQIALEEVKEDAILPHPVHVRDMMLRAHLTPGRALELNRKFQSYLEAFGEAQKAASSLLHDLAVPHND